MAIKEEEFKIDGVATDYSLIVQTEADPPETFVFKVHKTVLASASKVFAEMFMSGPKDSDPEKSGTCALQGDKVSTVRHFLNVIYRVSNFSLRSLTLQEAGALLTLTDKYDAPGIRRDVGRYLAHKVRKLSDGLDLYYLLLKHGFSEETAGLDDEITCLKRREYAEIVDKVAELSPQTALRLEKGRRTLHEDAMRAVYEWRNTNSNPTLAQNIDALSKFLF